MRFKIDIVARGFFNRAMKFARLLLFAVTSTIAFAAPADFDVIIKGGTIYDGSGDEGQHVDLAIRGDRIAGIGDFRSAKAKRIVDAKGLAVTPGFLSKLA